MTHLLTTPGLSFKIKCITAVKTITMESNPVRILIIDDNPEILEVVRLMLARHGYNHAMAIMFQRKSGWVISFVK